MIGSSELDAAKRDRDNGQASQPHSQRDETLVLDCSDDPTVTGLTDNTPPRHPTMLLNDLQQQEKSVHLLDLLRKAIAAAQSGNRILARLHLEEAVATNPDNPVGWLWLAWVADSPAATVSALEQSRLNFPNPTLLEHGLAWARGMQEFQLDLSGPIAECSKSDPLQEECPEDRCAGTAHPGPVTQRLEVAKATDPTQAGAAPGQTVPLDQETTPAKPLDGPIENEGGTGFTQRDEGPRQDAMATPSPQMAAESPVFDAGMTIAFDDGEFAEDLPQMSPLADASGPDGPPSIVDPSGDQPDDGVADEPSADDRTAVEDGSPGSTDLAPPCDQPTILAIDDSPTVRSLVSITLQKCGYQVVTATDGVDALDRIKSCKPALILMDINMPKLNGYQLCKLLKKNKEMREIPVIMLSGKDGVFDKLRGNMCGCDDYITKPFESADLVQKVSAFLAGVVTHT